jgi:hypothetical protein
MNSSLKQILLQERLMLSENPQGTDKGDFKSYVDKFYETAFRELRDKDTTLLEIGFRHGASLALWSHYFRQGIVVGIDNFSDIELRDSPPNQEWIGRANVRTFNADAYSPVTAASLEMEFDIIIDDGPHTLQSQKQALELYLTKLKPNGMFVIEDIQSRGRLALLSFSKLVPLNCTVEILDFRSDGKGDDNVLFVVRRTNSWQGLRRLASRFSACVSIFYEAWFHYIRPIWKQLR